jgi:hypothetical protein
LVDAFKGIIIMICLVIVFAVYPAYRSAERIESTSAKMVNSSLITFVDTVRGKGYIDVRDYETFLSALDSTGLVFDVTLEYYKKRIQPVYTDPNNYSTFQNSFSVRYDGYFTKEILDRLYPSIPLPEDDPQRRWNMKVGDLFNVRVESREVSFASHFRSWLFHTPKVPIILKYGGMIRSEAP